MRALTVGADELHLVMDGLVLVPGGLQRAVIIGGPAVRPDLETNRRGQNASIYILSP